MRFGRGKFYLLGLGIMGMGLAWTMVQEKRAMWHAEGQFLTRCRAEYAKPSDCEGLVDTNHGMCWSLTYTPRGKTMPKASFNAPAYYACVIDPPGYKRRRAAKARAKRKAKERYFIP